MFKNFENLERSLDFIESLDKKKLAMDERFKMLQTISEMQKKAEELQQKCDDKEKILADPSASKRKNQKSVDLRKHKKLNSQGKKSFDGSSLDRSSVNHDTENNLSKTRVILDKNTGLYNIQEYGYESPEGEN